MISPGALFILAIAASYVRTRWIAKPADPRTATKATPRRKYQGRGETVYHAMTGPDGAPVVTGAVDKAETREELETRWMGATDKKARALVELELRQFDDAQFWASEAKERGWKGKPELWAIEGEEEAC